MKNMKDMKCILVFQLVITLILMAGGVAEEQGGIELELQPTENADVTVDVPVDEPLIAEGEATSAALTLAPLSATLDYS